MLYRFSDEFAFISQFNFVSGTTPAFVLQTQPNLTAVPGQTIFTPHVSGAGTPPLTYQWSQNGTNIAGATNFILNITNVQWSNFGTYTVLITNAYGSASTNFTISLKPPKFNAAGSIATTNGFQLQITNIYAQNSVVISVSSNLINWFPLYTNGPATGAVSFVDLSATNFPQRFYRAAEQ